MTIDTRVFRRIVQEHREAGIQSVADTMQETVRFGTFSRPYVEGCAKDRYEAKLNQLARIPV